jgi:hypothetical protein
MMSRACLIIATIVAMGCGSGTKPSTPGYGGASGQQCLPNADCLSCIRQNCDSEAMTAFGGGYMNDQFNGGQCPNLMACSCTTNGTDNGNGSMDICAQQGGSGCVAAWNALNTCLENTPCFSTTCKTEGGNGGNGGNGGTSSNGLTVSGNTMSFGNVEVGTYQTLCMVVSGTNASITIPQILNDTSCAVGHCEFLLSAQLLNCTTSDSCNVCVFFSPIQVGAATATLNIAPGLTVALNGTGTSSTTGAGGATSTGGSACPLGTWIVDLGPSGCNANDTLAVTTITQSPSGQYTAVGSAGPLSRVDSATGQVTCSSVTSMSTSATYSDSNRVFTTTTATGSDTCTGKLVTSTMTINSDCTQAVVQNVFAGCGSCDAQENCQNCGSAICSPPAGTAVRSTH